MNRKIFVVCLILIAAVASLSLISAVSDINLPDGYQTDDSLAVVNQTTDFLGVEAIFNRVVMVNGDDNITVDSFLPSKDVTLTPTNGSEMKNISETEGLYQVVDGRCIFIYADNGQFVQVDAPNDKLIEEVIGE